MQNVLGFRLTVIASKNSRLVGAGLAPHAGIARFAP